MRDNLSNTALATIRKFNMLSPGDRVLAAVSGGADSMAMLWLLCSLRERYDLRLCAAHVNHGIRGDDALADEALVANACKTLDVPLQIRRVNVPALCRETGEGEEECGRRIRYEFFRSLIKDGKIATAHTLNDTAETVLMHLMRGTGLAGLCGIPPVRGNIIRPLIECSRETVEDYCRIHTIPFANDVTNEDDRYRRNAVRHHLIPYFTKQNPAFLAGMNRCVQVNRRDWLYLHKQGQTLLAQSATPKGYRLDVLKAGEEAPLYYAAGSLLEHHCTGTCTMQHRDDLIALIGRGSGSLSLPGGITACARNGLLMLEKQPPEAPQDFYCPVDADHGPYRIDRRQVTLGLRQNPSLFKNKKNSGLLTYNGPDCDKIGKNLFLRNRRPGDTITLPGRNCSKTLKKLFNELKIPPDERARKLILCDERGILWVEGIGCNAGCAPDAQTRQILIIQIHENP